MKIEELKMLPIYKDYRIDRLTNERELTLERMYEKATDKPLCKCGETLSLQESISGRSKCSPCAYNLEGE